MRHGEAAILERLPTVRSAAELAALPDHRYLSAMSLRSFRAGLRHRLVDARWPAFEEIFQNFDPAYCAGLPDETLGAMLRDRRLIRHLGKLRAIRSNARTMMEISRESGGFGAWLAAWEAERTIDLWLALRRSFQQMGGRSAPAFLRMVGRDTFLLTPAVIRGLTHFGAHPGEPRSRRELLQVQDCFLAWSEETGRPFAELSQILAMAVD